MILYYRILSNIILYDPLEAYGIPGDQSGGDQGELAEITRTLRVPWLQHLRSCARLQLYIAPRAIC